MLVDMATAMTVVMVAAMTTIVQWTTATVMVTMVAMVVAMVKPSRSLHLLLEDHQRPSLLLEDHQQPSLPGADEVKHILVEASMHASWCGMVQLLFWLADEAEYRCRDANLTSFYSSESLAMRAALNTVRTSMQPVVSIIHVLVRGCALPSSGCTPWYEELS